ncbi:MAG TPA: phosphodiester glycosidase family protein [Sphaerochaeta sp.]|nr:phosphodiester glycosidase family protein [Sphaerochaeta sp.]
MVSTIVTKQEEGEIQRFQKVEGFMWEKLRPQAPPFDKRVIGEIARLYQVTIIPKNPAKFGWFVFFRLDEALPFSLPMTQGAITFLDRNLAFASYVNGLVSEGEIAAGDRLVVNDPVLREYLDRLAAKGLLSIAKGTADSLRFMPISDELGFPSSVEGDLVVNSHFFLMDPSDLDTPFCSLGSPYSLSVHRGVVELPPLNERPALFVDKAGDARIEFPHLSDLKIEVDGIPLEGEIHTRRGGRSTPPSDNHEIVIVGRRVVALSKGGGTPVPMAGFVVGMKEAIAIREGNVAYKGYEEIVFAIQVGPSMMNEGAIVDSFDCDFHDPERHDAAFPPTVYPLDFNTGRAARIALGTNNKGKPILLWAEGASKVRYVPGVGSRGASLLELARFCEEEGYVDIVNLDGGGSAQILIDGKRHLQISDRYPSDEEAERPIPRVLVIDRS